MELHRPKQHLHVATAVCDSFLRSHADIIKAEAARQAVLLPSLSWVPGVSSLSHEEESAPSVESGTLFTQMSVHFVSVAASSSASGCNNMPPHSMFLRFIQNRAGRTNSGATFLS